MKTFRSIDGVLILDKPVGLSSNQALQRARHIFQAKKAGHTGTLDLLASGLLPICFGEATKFSQFLLDADKYYRVTAELGKRTSTCDSEGDVISERSTLHVDQKLLEQILQQFRGEIEQVPSMYSALKHNGVPLYQLARQGKTVERKARRITIYELNLLERNKNFVTLDVKCSKGTYIRNLVEDIGEALQCGAYVMELRRLGAGPFRAEQMITIPALEQHDQSDGFAAIDDMLLPIDILLTGLPKCQLTSEESKQLRQGKRLVKQTPCTGLVRLYENPTQFLGVGECIQGELISKRLIAAVMNQ